MHGKIATVFVGSLLWFVPGVPFAHADLIDSLESAGQAIEKSICEFSENPKCRKKSAKSPRKTPAATSRKKAAGADDGKTVVPIPRSKPSLTGAGQEEVRQPAAAEELPADGSVPVPRRKPQEIAMRKIEVAPPPKQELKTAGQPLDRPGAPYDGRCHEKLSGLGVAFKAEATPVASGNCSVVDPVRLQSVDLGPGKVAFPDGPLLNCVFAVRLAQWLKERGAPAAREAGSPLAKFYTGPGYECRGRNGDTSGKISEHGYGNAVDVTYVELQDGRTLNVADAANMSSSAFLALAQMRKSACEYFSTVLGPGSNAAHDSHFHLDNGKHGKSGTYRICE